MNIQRNTSENDEKKSDNEHALTLGLPSANTGMANLCIDWRCLHTYSLSLLHLYTQYGIYERVCACDGRLVP